MKFIIKHEIDGRMRICTLQRRMTCTEADILQYHLEKISSVTSVRIQERSQSVVIYYSGKRDDIISALKTSATAKLTCRRITCVIRAGN